MEDILQSVKNYNVHLHPAKCSFRVQAEKFLGFMLIKRAIEANLDNFMTIVDMIRPTNNRVMQELTGCLDVLSRFLLCETDKAFLFFVVLEKKDKFEWS